jgi:LPXTG-site transpeptidase (sortase) family protein
MIPLVRKRETYCMRQRKSIVAACIFIGALLVFSFIATHALWWAPESDIAPPGQAVVIAATSSLPSRMYIPSLNIDANVQHVGIAASGNMGVPSNFTDVGWYRYGTVPGQRGSAVIDGHVDNGLSLPGVFKRLSEIKVGDDVYIEDSEGQKLHFVVYDVEVYPYKSVPMKTVFAASGTANLNLITCEGSWLQSGRTYDHRIVVYTKLVQ